MKPEHVTNDYWQAISQAGHAVASYYFGVKFQHGQTTQKLKDEIKYFELSDYPL